MTTLLKDGWKLHLAGRQKALPRSTHAAGATAVATVLWSGRRSVEELWTYAEPGLSGVLGMFEKPVSHKKNLDFRDIKRDREKVT